MLELGPDLEGVAPYGPNEYGGMAPKLDEFAKLCGFPGKIDVKGDQVTDLWLGREITKIVEYNQIDTLNTYLVWLRLVYFAGMVTEEAYMLEQELFRPIRLRNGLAVDIRVDREVRVVKLHIGKGLGQSIGGTFHQWRMERAAHV